MQITNSETTTTKTVQTETTKLRTMRHITRSTSNAEYIARIQLPHHQVGHAEKNRQAICDKGGKEKMRIPAEEIHLKIGKMLYVHAARFRHAVKTAHKAEKTARAEREQIEQMKWDVKGSKNATKIKEKELLRCSKIVRAQEERLEQKRKMIRDKDKEINQLRNRNVQQTINIASLQTNVNQMKKPSLN